MNLDSLRLPRYIKVNYTQRLFFGKYCYKVVVEVDRKKLEPESDNPSYYWKARYKNRKELIMKIRDDLVNIGKDKKTFRIRQEYLTTGFFTNDESHVVEIYDKFGAQVLEITRPCNIAHVEFLEKNRKVLVRKSLFNNKFKFKIYLNPYNMRTERFAPVKEFLSNFGKNTYDVNKILEDFWSTGYKHSVKYLGWTVAVYLNSVEDLMMFQLKFNDDIIKIEEIRLLYDLK